MFGLIALVGSWALNAHAGAGIYENFPNPATNETIKYAVVTNMAAAVENAAGSSNHVASSSLTASAAGHTNVPNMLDDHYRLVIGDQLSFQIIEDKDDPVHLTVTDSGDLQIPYLGRYPATGKTCKELAEALKMELEKKYYKQATVIIAVDLKPRSRGKIYLVGAITAPGPQELSSDETLTVSKAILRAGGLTGFADGKDVKITRSNGTAAGGEKSFIVNVTEIYEKGKTENDLPLQPGDLIFVPERMIRF
jgi:polysaccharide export outer membrane protein